MTERLKTLLEMLKENLNDSFIRYAVAKEYEGNNDLENALENYLIIKDSDPEYVGMYYHLAKLYETLEQFENAINTYNEGINIAKKLPDFHALSELNSAKMNLEMEL